MHKFFFGDVQLPFPPSALKLSIKNKNKTVDLINEGEVNQLKAPGLTQVEFKFELPFKKRPHVQNFKSQKYFLDRLEKLKLGKKPFQFIVVRQGGFGTNLKVALEEYDIEESALNGRDLSITVKLKQYREYGLKTIVIPPKPKPVLPAPAPKRDGEPDRSRIYTVVSGDCLWIIARRYYGDGAQWPKIYNANRDKIRDPDLIYPAQVFIIPA